MKKRAWLKTESNDIDVSTILQNAAAKRRAREQLKIFSRAIPEPLAISSLSDIPDFIRPIDLAEKLKKHVESVLRDIRRGALKARKDGRSYLIDPKDVSEYLSRLEFESGQKKPKSA